MRPSPIFLCLALCVGLSHLVAAPLMDPTPAMTADDIIQRAILRDEVLRRERQRYECDVNVKTEKLDAKGTVTSTKALNATMRPTRQISFGGELQSEKQGRDYTEARKFMAVLDLQKLAPRFQLSRDPDAELSAIHVARDAADLDRLKPAPFADLYMRHVWAGPPPR